MLKRSFFCFVFFFTFYHSELSKVARKSKCCSKCAVFCCMLFMPLPLFSSSQFACVDLM